MGSEKKRLNLAFSLSSPLQREAWEVLDKIPPGRKTDAICKALCGKGGEEAFLNQIRMMIREELSRISIKEKQEQRTEAGDVGDEVLGFLASLQEDEGGDEESDSS